MKLAPSLFLTLGVANAFQRPFVLPFMRTASLNAMSGDSEHIMNKVNRLLQSAPPFDEQFDQMVKSIFPGAINNSDFEYRVVAALDEKGFTASNTLLATSLCSDELAKRLADDFVKLYGNNFNLGGLAGFPFAGNIGFQTMSGHIPDNGYSLIVFGPHVGLTEDGVIGRVERAGISLNDYCCRSAIEATDYVMGYSNGAVDSFTDLQQSAVQDLLVPIADRLKVADYPMLELPYAIYDSQNQLMQSIIDAGVHGTKKGIALLGGIQINTGPNTLDYFHPLRFDFINNKGEIVEDMLYKIS